MCGAFHTKFVFTETSEPIYEEVGTETFTETKSSTVSSAISTEVNEAYLLTVAISMETDVTTVDSNNED